MIGNRSRYRWQRDSHKMVSGMSGAIHSLEFYGTGL